MKFDCLYVDDEKVLVDTVCEYLGMYGVSAKGVLSAEEAFALDYEFSVALLDINLTGIDGFELCRKLKERNHNLKVFFMSARNGDDDLVKGYRIGGDDYVTKPFSLAVLLEKIKLALKKPKSEFYRGLEIYPDEMTVIKDGEKIAFKNMEFRLFYYLFSNRGRVVDKNELIAKVWGDGYYTENTLNVHINRVREKLSENPQEYVATVWGTGYRFI